VQKDPDARIVNLKSNRIFWLLIPITLIVACDEWLKSLAIKRLPLEGSLVDPGILSLAIHKNLGIAFDIPFKLELIILFSIVIGGVLLHMAYRHTRSHPQIAFAALVIVIGAMGNVYDRLAYGFTVDYLILFGRSALNLSDLVIILGVILLLMFSRRKQKIDTMSKIG
jgi:signal peptidase II